MFAKSLTAAALLAAKASATIYYAGVAESGGEFSVYSMLRGRRQLWDENSYWRRAGDSGEVGFGLPGRFGVDYQFIDEDAIDIYVDENQVNSSALDWL